MPPPDLDPIEQIRLAVPSGRNHGRVARATAAAVAACSGFNANDIDDVRIAVTELTAALIQADPLSDVDYEFGATRDEFVAAGHARVTACPRLTRLAERVMDTVVDGFDLWECDGSSHFRATKQPSHTRS